MPITITTNQLQYRNSNNTFTPISTIGDISSEALLNKYQEKIDIAINELKEYLYNFKSSIATDFNTSENYIKGAYVWYLDTLYKFIEAHAAGEWNGTDVEEVQK